MPAAVENRAVGGEAEALRPDPVRSLQKEVARRTRRIDFAEGRHAYRERGLRPPFTSATIASIPRCVNSRESPQDPIFADAFESPP